MEKDLILNELLQIEVAGDDYIVEVFSTNVTGEAPARQLVEKMLVSFPDFRINFDLEDCDRVLRVKGREVDPGEIISIMESEGYQCRLME